MNHDNTIVCSWFGQLYNTIYLPDSSKAHLFTGKLPWPLHTVILSFSLQIHIQTHTETCHLVGKELVTWTRSLQLMFEHVHLTLHSLKCIGQLELYKKVNTRAMYELRKISILSGCHQCIHCALPSSWVTERKVEGLLGSGDSSPQQPVGELIKGQVCQKIRI